MYARKAMFPEGGDADATATYVSMLLGMCEGKKGCIHVFFLISRICLFVCIYPSAFLFL